MRFSTYNEDEKRLQWKLRYEPGSEMALDEATSFFIFSTKVPSSTAAKQPPMLTCHFGHERCISVYNISLEEEETKDCRQMLIISLFPRLIRIPVHYAPSAPLLMSITSTLALTRRQLVQKKEKQRLFNNDVLKASSSDFVPSQIHAQGSSSPVEWIRICHLPCIGHDNKLDFNYH